MPRTKGAKNKQPLSLDEKISAAENELEQLKTEVKAREEALSALQSLKNEQEIHALMDAIAESGLTVQNVIDMVKAGKAQA